MTGCLAGPRASFSDGCQGRSVATRAAPAPPASGAGAAPAAPGHVTARGPARVRAAADGLKRSQAPAGTKLKRGDESE